VHGKSRILIPPQSSRSTRNGKPAAVQRSAGQVNGKENGHPRLSGKAGLARGNSGDGGELRRVAPAAEVAAVRPIMRSLSTSDRDSALTVFANRPRLRHDLESFVVGPSNQLAFNAATYVAEFPGAQYNPLFVHGNCGLGKTHLLQGLSRR